MCDCLRCECFVCVLLDSIIFRVRCVCVLLCVIVCLCTCVSVFCLWPMVRCCTVRVVRVAVCCCVFVRVVR